MRAWPRVRPAPAPPRPQARRKPRAWGVPGGAALGRKLGIWAVSAAAPRPRVPLCPAPAPPGGRRPQLAQPPAHLQRPPPEHAAGRRCRCSGSVAAATRGAAAAGAAGTPPGRTSSPPLGGPAWRGLPGRAAGKEEKGVRGRWPPLPALGSQEIKGGLSPRCLAVSDAEML